MDGDLPISFLGRRTPATFARRVVFLAPGQSRAYDPAQWRAALVLVEEGQIELECLDGSHHVFEQGSILWLDRLPLRSLYNPTNGPTILVAVSRRPDTSGR